MPTFFPLVFVGVFGGIAGAAWVARYRSRRQFADLEAHGVSVDGVVVKETKVDGGDDAFDVIFVEFQDGKGETHRVRSTGASSLFPPPGARTRVLYHVDRPGEARLLADRENGELGLTILTLAFGGIATLAAVAQFIVLAVTRWL